MSDMGNVVDVVKGSGNRKPMAAICGWECHGMVLFARIAAVRTSGQVFRTYGL
jgi:hypothetical protein